MGISETDPLHRQIKALMHSMVLWAKNHGYTPVYFQVAPFKNFEIDLFGQMGEPGAEVEVPLQELDGYPVVYKDGQCKLYCRDWVVLKVNQVIKIGKASWENGLLNIPVDGGIRYFFVHECDDEFI